MAETARAGHDEESSGHGFGTAPVFLASISTILGAIMFLRFGYAVGNAGLLGAFLIILLGHAVTVPTALAIAGRTIPNDVPATPAPTKRPAEAFSIHGLSTPDISTIPSA